MSIQCGAFGYDDTDCVLRECQHRTRHGFLCWQHARSLLGVELRTSLIQDAGLGLFAARRLPRYHVIDEYMGELQTREEFDADQSEYAVEVDEGRVINSVDATSCFARYANDMRVEAANNCWLITDAEFGKHYARPRYQHGSETRVFLITKRVVQPGEELCCSYGNDTYWLD